MANPIKGEVPLDIAGRRYTLVIGTYALAALERRMKMPWPKLFKKAADGEWGIDEVLAAFHAGLLRHHRNMSEEQAADLIDQAGLEYVNTALAEAVKLMGPQQSSEGGEGAENPPQPTTNGAGMISSQTGSR